MIRRILIPSKEIQVIDIRNLCKRRKQLDPTDITKCPSARAIITDQDSNVLADETIPSGETRTIQVNTGGLPPLYTYPYSSFNTGQISSFAVGDDVWVRENVFNPEIASWPTDRPWVTPILDPNSPTKLLFGSNPDGSGNNIFGNKERFTDLVGGQNYVNEVVIDHFTGEMKTKNYIVSSLDWETILNYHNNLVFAGKNDWHCGNSRQYELSAIEWFSGLNYPPFNYSVGTGDANSNLLAWTSTTSSFSSGSAVRFNNNYNQTNSGFGIGYRFIGRAKNQSQSIGLSFRKAFTYNPITGQMELT
jgi:hypothetical protein